MRPLRWIALIVLMALAIVVALAPVLFDRQPVTIGAVLTTQTFWYVIPGLVVMVKRPWHQVGWLLILLGIGLALTSLPPTPRALDARWHPWFTWVTGSWGGYFGYSMMGTLLVVFPDGLSHRSGRDRRIGRRIIGTLAAMTLLAAGTNPVGATENGASGQFSNPLGLHLVPQAASDFGFLPVVLLMVGCVVWLWRRQRRERGEARRRYTLVLYTFAMLVVGLLFGLAFSAVIGQGAWLGAYLGWFAVPVAFAYAIVRHGLYGVDRLVRRTVNYGLVAVVVATVYVVPVLLLPGLLGQSNDLVITASTLSAAAAFNPVRRRVQQAVDRRFDRAKYDAEHEVDGFASRLTHEFTRAALVAELLGVLHRTLSPDSAAVWLKDMTPVREEAP
jgi:hypothetical protein